jgi:hypothetical protein
MNTQMNSVLSFVTSSIIPKLPTLSQTLTGLIATTLSELMNAEKLISGLVNGVLGLVVSLVGSLTSGLVGIATPLLSTLTTSLGQVSV